MRTSANRSFMRGSAVLAASWAAASTFACAKPPRRFMSAPLSASGTSYPAKSSSAFCSGHPGCHQLPKTMQPTAAPFKDHPWGMGPSEHLEVAATRAKDQCCHIGNRRR